MVLFCLLIKFEFTILVAPLWGVLHGFYSAWLCCNSLEWNDHSASLRFAMRRKNRTLPPIQLSLLG